MSVSTHRWQPSLSALSPVSGPITLASYLSRKCNWPTYPGGFAAVHAQRRKEGQEVYSLLQVVASKEIELVSFGQRGTVMGIGDYPAVCCL